jgi:hypothetical protein
MMLHLLPPTTTYVKCELAKGRRTAIGSFRTMLHLLLPPIAMAGIAFIISRQDLSQSQHNPTETPLKHLQKVALATESVSTQPRKPANKGSNDVQEASKVTPTKYLKNSSCDGVDSGLSSDNDPSTATPHFSTDASFDERKPAFKTTPCGSNKSIQDVEGNAGNYDNTDAFDVVEDTEFDFVQDVEDTLIDNDSVHEDDNDEETHPEVDMELEDKGDGVPSNQDDVEPSANVPELVDKPRSALDENQPDHLINTRLPKPSMKYETIPVYNFLPLHAPQRQAYLLFE